MKNKKKGHARDGLLFIVKRKAMAIIQTRMYHTRPPPAHRKNPIRGVQEAGSAEVCVATHALKRPLRARGRPATSG